MRSILEQSYVVWHSSLTEENSTDLESVQKAAVRIILEGKYQNYQEALIKIDLDTLFNRREDLSKKNAVKCFKSENDKTKNMFPIRNQQNKKTRKKEPYLVNFAYNKRLKDSAIPYMQRLLNKDQALKEI